jgi:antitoxin component YwqK of YwqJK toxin-antitoxin module
MKIKTTYFDTLGWMIRELIFEEGGIDLTFEEKNYRDSLINGQFYRYHPTGTIAQSGKFIEGKRINTEWKDFYISGQQFREYIFTGENEWNIKIINIWDEEGMQTVKNGKGKHVTYTYCQNGKQKAKIVTRYQDGLVIETKEYKISVCR